MIHFSVPTYTPDHDQPPLRPPRPSRRRVARARPCGAVAPHVLRSSVTRAVVVIVSQVPVFPGSDDLTAPPARHPTRAHARLPGQPDTPVRLVVAAPAGRCLVAHAGTPSPLSVYKKKKNKAARQKEKQITAVA